MYERAIFQEAKRVLTQFRAVCVTGPRQSGKTTLCKMLFKGKPYLTFENPAIQYEAELNPAAFMEKYKNGAILDEVQRVPDIFRVLQGMLDKNRKRGQFLLTGSNNFLLNERISQSLAGRAGYLSLLPLSYDELKISGRELQDADACILKGGFPEIWKENLHPDTWLRSYVQTYVQRDVRLLRNIENLGMFNRFLYLCAHYSGRMLNREALGRQTGVDNKTIQAWLGLLESSYIIFQVQPWHNNLNKRITKTPKLYFHDTALLCHLLGIKSKTALRSNHGYGAIFENWVVAEIQKNLFNAGYPGNLFYFRDNAGNEVDLILPHKEQPMAIEIKAGRKPDLNMVHGLKFWQKYQAGMPALLVYGGNKTIEISESISAIPWNEIGDI